MLNDNEEATTLETTDGGAAASESGATRREFIGKTLAASAGLAAGAALPHHIAATAVDPQPPSCLAAGQPLAIIGEIVKTVPNGPVKGTVKVLNQEKAYLGKANLSTTGLPPNTTCQTGQMRYFTGSIPDTAKPGTYKQVWPPATVSPTPGPTLRARVGDRMEITLLNQVDVAAFGNSLDAGGCDTLSTPSPTGGAPTNTYPGNPPFDDMPDCFHGSSTANLHYHGTHVSPNILADNVFVQLRPSPRDKATNQPIVNEAFLAKNGFNSIFTHCANGHSPTVWGDLPLPWQQRQEELLKGYDENAQWKGQRGLPPEERLWPKNAVDIHAARWPQYYVGAYPSCFTLPTWDGDPATMGQSPGTHWYHAHKHGSTALNLANGLAGAFIIEGDYDDKLRPYFDKEVVLVLQQYGAQVNLLRPAGTNKGDLVFVNGQYTPQITMRPGEIQLWRVVNACHQTAVALTAPTTGGLTWVQTAQDGVQLDPRNYALAKKNAPMSVPMVAPWFGSLAPGNRVDLLVQAPTTIPSGPLAVTNGGGLLFTVNVAGTAVSPAKQFPTQAQFPPMPGFLHDINPADVVVRRELRFKTDPKTGRAATTNNPPEQLINGKKFSDHHIDQTMQLGATEEWTLYNDSGPAHPFHIHINPFQIIEILNPAVSIKPVDLRKATPWIWWDVIGIPPAAIPPDATGDDKGKVVAGYIKFLSRFVDYTGVYVLHCHILGHEDRGMMEMVQVISPSTTVGHH